MKTPTLFIFLMLAGASLYAQEFTVAEAFDQPAYVTASELAQKKVNDKVRYVSKCVVIDQRINDQCMAFGGGWNFILNVNRPFAWPKDLERPRLRPGDEIEFSGDLLNNDQILQVDHVVYRVIGRDRTVPVPVELRESDLANYPHKCDLVRLTAPLGFITKQFEGGLHTMRFQLGDKRDIVGLMESKKELLRNHIPDACMLEVTGFLTREEEGRSYIWTRSPEDVRVVGLGPDALRQIRMKWTLAISLVAAAIGLWIYLLRRQVRMQTAKLTQANLRLKTSEAELITNLAREKEISDLKSNFVSMVSHEFRTPLAVILSSTELLRNHLARLNEETRRTQMDNIVQSTKLMSGMIEEVLLLGTVEGGRMVCTPIEIDLAGFAAVLVDEGLSATKQRCPIRLSIGAIPTQAKADPALLRHIFSNLLSNAVKYSPEGESVDFNISAEGRHAICIIQDRGIGIPEQDLAHLFEAFHRASNVGQRTGTGLGLVITKRCVELHGGSIKMQSSESTGTTVTVKLPIFA
jgi:signal transduction histidine kinase